MHLAFGRDAHSFLLISFKTTLKLLGGPIMQNMLFGKAKRAFLVSQTQNFIFPKPEKKLIATSIDR